MKTKTASRQTKAVIILLVFFMVIVLWYTVLMRASGFYDAQLEPFWSYKGWLAGNWKLGREILANIAMFFPLGFLLSAATVAYCKKTCLVVFIAGSLLSTIIEVLQLVLMRGLFEFDDIFSNTLGSLLGYFAYKLLEGTIKKDYITKIVLSFGVFFVLTGMAVCINANLKKDELKYNIPRDICFQVDDVKLDGDRLILTGFAFCNNRNMSDFEFILKSTKTGEELKADVKYGLQRSDVARYFNSKQDYSKAGYRAYLPVVHTEEEYEIILRLHGLTSFLTDVLVTGTDIHYTKLCDFVPPEVAGTSLEEIVKNGYLRVYRPDRACYVYQYKGFLYWIADTAFHFEKNGKTIIQCHLWTTQPEKLPQKRLINKWYWDNIGFNFDNHEITGSVNCGKYRVCRQKLPQEYSITSILTGYYKNGEWIWLNYFRPVYEF